MEKYKDQPFVLLGVNSDPKDVFRKAIEEEGFTWRSWWDGGSTEGPIQQQWKVRGYPTSYLIDGKGVIRGGVGISSHLEPRIEALIAELKRPD